MPQIITPQPIEVSGPDIRIVNASARRTSFTATLYNETKVYWVTHQVALPALENGEILRVAWNLGLYHARSYDYTFTLGIRLTDAATDNDNDTTLSGTVIYPEVDVVVEDLAPYRSFFFGNVYTMTAAADNKFLSCHVGTVAPNGDGTPTITVQAGSGLSVMRIRP